MYLHAAPGQNIARFARLLLLVNKLEGTIGVFNEVELSVYPDDELEDLMIQYNTKSQARYNERVKL